MQQRQLMVAADALGSIGDGHEPLAFTSGGGPITIDVVDLFSPPTIDDSSTADARNVASWSADVDFHFDFARFAPAAAAIVAQDRAVDSPTPSSVSSTVAPASHTSSGTESEHTVESAARMASTTSSSTSSRSTRTGTDATAAAAQAPDPTDPAELRRKRNRESMRRVRLRKRDAKRTTQQTVDALEATLQRMMETNARAAQQLALAQSHRPAAASARCHDAAAARSSSDTPTYAELLSETAALSFANKSLRDAVQTHCVAEASLARMLDDEQLQVQTSSRPLDDVLTEADAQRADAAMLAPLLAWLTPRALDALTALATRKIEANTALVASLVPEPNVALGWTDQRCVDGTTARYLLRKTFRHESAESLASKTWACIVDIAKLSQIMRWAKGMKVLHWLSDDAAIVTRELTIPSPRGPASGPTRFRFTLLVYKMRTRDGGYCIGTINLNVFGTSVDECLAKDATYHGGVHAHTMYGWTFTPSSADSGEGCTVELAGLTANGTLAYAHNVVMEMITVVLLWESALVAQLKLLRT